jgi:hypothetical protein
MIAIVVVAVVVLVIIVDNEVVVIVQGLDQDHAQVAISIVEDHNAYLMIVRDTERRHLVAAF